MLGLKTATAQREFYNHFIQGISEGKWLSDGHINPVEKVNLKRLERLKRIVIKTSLDLGNGDVSEDFPPHHLLLKKEYFPQNLPVRGAFFITYFL